MKRALFFLGLLVAINTIAWLLESPRPAPPPVPAIHTPPIVESCVPDHAESIEVYFDLVGRCALPQNLRDALKAAIAADSIEERAKVLLDAARNDPRFRQACALSDDALATHPMLEHPTLDACTHDARFAADPWATNTTFLCHVEIATYLFVDVLATYVPIDERLVRGLLEEDGAGRHREDVPYWTQSGWSRKLACDPAHPAFVAHANRVKEAADAYNAEVASGDAGALYPSLF